jgi:plastocyanin
MTLRMLRRIQERLPHKVRLCPGYTVTYWTEMLECGHSVTAYQKENLTAKRRVCPKCSKALAKAA